MSKTNLFNVCFRVDSLRESVLANEHDIFTIASARFYPLEKRVMELEKEVANQKVHTAMVDLLESADKATPRLVVIDHNGEDVEFPRCGCSVDHGNGMLTVYPLDDEENAIAQFMEWKSWRME